MREKIFRFFRKSLNYIGETLLLGITKVLDMLKRLTSLLRNNFLITVKEIAKLVKVLALLVTISIVLSLIFKEYQDLILKVFSLAFTTYFLIRIVRFATWINNRIEINELKSNLQNPVKEGISLYSWMGNSSIDYSFFYNILKDESIGDTLENLQKIKDNIINKIGEEKSDYYLLKSYLDAKERTSITEKFSTWFFGIIVALLTAGLSKAVTSEKASSFMSKFLNNKDYFKIDNLTIFIDILNFSLFFISLFIYLINEFYREKRKIELIKGVVDSIIYEKENTK